jgi:hypothetical protein
MRQRLADLQAELESETARLKGELDPAAVSIDKQSIKSRKSETTATGVAVVWVAM